MEFDPLFVKFSLKTLIKACKLSRANEGVEEEKKEGEDEQQDKNNRLGGKRSFLDKQKCEPEHETWVEISDEDKEAGGDI